jgi:tetratricopeptide (TPR) repeat protein
MKSSTFSRTIYGLLISSSIGFTACNSNNGSGAYEKNSGKLEDQVRKERIEHSKKVFDKALKAGDNITELNMAYSLMVDDSANALKYMDTAAAIYERVNMIPPALKMADMILAKDPTNEKMLELKSMGSANKGNHQEAIDINRKLYEREHKVKYLFNVASVQIDQKDWKSLEGTLKEIESSPNIDKDSFTTTDPNTGSVQMVPNRAALAYIRGLEAGEKKDFAGAMRYFGQSLKIYPDFIMAKRYIMAIEQASKQGQQPQR